MPERGVWPLFLKLVAVNVGIITLLLLLWIWAGTGHAALVISTAVVAVVVQALGVASLLTPVREVEEIAVAKWQHEFGDQVPAAPDDKAAGPMNLPDVYVATVEKLESDRVRLRALATGLIVAGEDERSTVARTLFDSTAQHLAALLLELSTASRAVDRETVTERLQVARDVAATALEEVRHLAETVHPNVLDTLGLVPALRKLARAMSRGNGIEIDVITWQESIPLSSVTQTVLYRVAEESLRNALRHASPKQINIKLSTVQDVLSLEVHDNGIGFDSEQALRDARGGGLAGIRDQVELIGGTLLIRTAVGNGTSVVAALPLRGTAFGAPV